MVTIIFKIRRLVKMIRKSSILSNFVLKKASELKLNVEVLILDFQVRWNSTYLMLARLVKFKGIIYEITSQTDKINGLRNKQIEKCKKLEITNDDWEIIESVNKVLKPFYDVTNLVSGSNYQTLSLAKPAEYIIKTALQTYINENAETSTIFILSNLLLESLDYYFNFKMSAYQKTLSLVIF